MDHLETREKVVQPIDKLDNNNYEKSHIQDHEMMRIRGRNIDLVEDLPSKQTKNENPRNNTYSKKRVQDEYLLTENPNRYVMFPIQDNDIWRMYKKQEDCFWRVEEIDFSKDIDDWLIVM